MTEDRAMLIDPPDSFLSAQEGCMRFPRDLYSRFFRVRSMTTIIAHFDPWDLCRDKEVLYAVHTRCLIMNHEQDGD